MNQHRILTLSLAAALAAPLASAQECEPTTKSCEVAAPNSDYATAQKQLTKAWYDFKDLAAIERDALKAASKSVKTKSATGRALAPTYGAAADLLLAAATLEGDAKKKERLRSMSAAYRALARDLGGRKNFPEPVFADAEAARAGIAKATEAADRAKALWAAAKESPDGKDLEAQWALLKQGCPRFAAATRIARSLNGNMSSAACDTTDCETSPAEEAFVRARELDALAIAAFAGAKEKVVVKADPPPAPS